MIKAKKFIYISKLKLAINRIPKMSLKMLKYANSYIRHKRTEFKENNSNMSCYIFDDDNLEELKRLTNKFEDQVNEVIDEKYESNEKFCGLKISYFFVLFPDLIQFFDCEKYKNKSDYYFIKWIKQ
ncbi:hypothetical protein EDEG_04033 [Edhazardia aedis USNM 41457]|uniref:Uncharacterized protein n=1 Tax=Edhazardia aedis (strain USNM 41457) TaxID=1003232 RepID=J9DF87_EDHAE|nr:hypothetical protein EDEG_04033 [Edhazardia aedis USNM 41457]|eukprot:EJW01270.1 hypothetical protein EDEG_04033 [Edhazardia aedis USNM 41457]